MNCNHININIHIMHWFVYLFVYLFFTNLANYSCLIFGSKKYKKFKMHSQTLNTTFHHESAQTATHTSRTTDLMRTAVLYVNSRGAFTHSHTDFCLEKGHSWGLHEACPDAGLKLIWGVCRWGPHVDDQSPRVCVHSGKSPHRDRSTNTHTHTHTHAC